MKTKYIIIFFMWCVMGYLFLKFNNLQTGMQVSTVTEESIGPFVTTWKTDNSGVSSNNQIKLPLISTGTYDFVVDWGDDSTSSITTYNDPETTHTYSTAGTYTVSITGTLRGWQFYYSDDYEKIIEVSSWGCLEIYNDWAFGGCVNMDITATDPLEVGGSLEYMFDDCFSYGTSTTTVLDFSNWTTNNITSLESMFDYCEFMTNLDISTWDVSNVTNTGAMFIRCWRLVELDLSSWNLGNLDWGASMFRYCNLLETIGDTSSWNTSNLRVGSFMFQGCYSLTDLNITNWNTSKLEAVQSMFSSMGTPSLDFSSWDFRLVSNFTNFLYDTTLSNTDYGKLWDRFYEQKDDMYDSRSFHGGGSQLTPGSSAETARDYFINTKGWTVVDGDT